MPKGDAMPGIVRSKLQDSEENYRNTTYWDIYPLFLLVQEGDEKHLRQDLHIRLESFPAGRITGDRRKQLEYLAVSLVNTFMIAAIQGGVYPPDANAAADTALRCLARTKSTEEFPTLIEETAAALCGMVREAKDAHTGNRHAEKVRHYLEEHLTQDIRLSDVAEAAGLSRSYLCRVFRASTGQTIQGYLASARVKAAKELLSSSEYTIPQIASLLGFCDQSYFTKVFRETEGITPGTYRERERR